MSSEEKEELMNKNLLDMVKQLLSVLVFKYWTQTLSAIGICVTICIFYLNTRATNTEFPKLKYDFEQHEKQESINRTTDQDAVKEVSKNVEILMVKIDDIKKYGRGEYHEETTDTIKIIKRHRK